MRLVNGKGRKQTFSALCEKLADKCEFKSMAWDCLIPSLTENKVDFIIGAFSVTGDVARSSISARRTTLKVRSSLAPSRIQMLHLCRGVYRFRSRVDQAALRQDRRCPDIERPVGLYDRYLPDVSTGLFRDTADNSVTDLVAGRRLRPAPDLSFRNFLKTSQGEDDEVKLVTPKSVVLGEGVAYAVRGCLIQQRFLKKSMALC